MELPYRNARNEHSKRGWRPLPIYTTVAYFFHEPVWAGIKWAWSLRRHITITPLHATWGTGNASCSMTPISLSGAAPFDEKASAPNILAHQHAIVYEKTALFHRTSKSQPSL
jgi:hypothetical protein